MTHLKKMSVCLYCHEPANEKEKLIVPCNCARVHLSCLLNKFNANPDSFLTCEICNVPYIMKHRTVKIPRRKLKCHEYFVTFPMEDGNQMTIVWIILAWMTIVWIILAWMLSSSFVYIYNFNPHMVVILSVLAVPLLPIINLIDVRKQHVRHLIEHVHDWGETCRAMQPHAHAHPKDEVTTHLP